MITKFENYSLPDNEILNFPMARNGNFGGEGTHVMCLPSDKYPKKYWNKITYVSVDSRGNYSMHDMIGSNKERLSQCGKNYSSFFSPAKPNIHFNWILGTTIYDNTQNIVGHVTEQEIEENKIKNTAKKYNL